MKGGAWRCDRAGGNGHAGDSELTRAAPGLGLHKGCCGKEMPDRSGGTGGSGWTEGKAQL